MDIYYILLYFFVYGFLGWCSEVGFAAFKEHRFVNRGFLNGPICPIYGVGVTIVIAFLTPYKDNLIILYVSSVILVTLLEGITGWAMDKIFHNKWWDYSNKPFNLHGYVCLKFSIYWGLACTFVMDVLHPIIYKGITMIPHILGVVLLSIIMAGFAVDCGVTVTTILKFNKRLKVMDEMAAKIHKLSDEIGENIYENVTTAVEKSEEFQETHEELLTKISDKKENIKEIPANAKARIEESAESTRMKLAETKSSTREKIVLSAEERKERIAESAENARERIAESTEAAKEKIAAYKENREAARLAKQKEKEELEKKYKELFAEKNFGFKRLMKAFPDMTSREQNESLEKYKKYFNIRKPDHKKDE